MKPVIEAQNLSIHVQQGKRQAPAVKDVSFHVGAGEIVGIVGESGCGKSMTAMALMGLLPKAAKIESGSILYNGRDITRLGEKDRCSLRGKEISIIFQEPMSALNPLMTVGRQIEEAYRLHHDCTKREAYDRTVDIMQRAGLPRVESLYKEYPHRLSGGMKQRIVIAMALINQPKVLIADEPTTALDVTIQHQILELIMGMAQESGASVVLISHDLGVIKEVCQRVLVMYAGRIVEEGKAKDILGRPIHPYTRGLLDSIPSVEKKGKRLYNIPGNIAPLHQRKEGGCGFADRCEVAADYCFTKEPGMASDGLRCVMCHKNGGLLLEKQRTA